MSEPRRCNLDAEMSVLGAWMINNQAIDDVVGLVDPDDFYRAGHRLIAATALDLHRAGVVVDLITLTEALTAAGQIEQAGGPAYIAKLVDGVPHSSHVAHYAGIVRNHALRRRLEQEAMALAALSRDDDAQGQALIEEAEARIFALSSKSVTRDLVPMRDLVPELLEQLQALAEFDGRAVTGLATGFSDFDKMTCGLQRGDLILIGGRPSMGKSSFVQDIALHVGITLQAPVAFFSAEMARRMLMLRTLIARAQVDGFRVRHGRFGPSDYERLMRAIGDLESSQIYIDDSSGIRPMEVRSKCRRLKARLGQLPLVIIDYVQLMRSDLGRRYENRNLELTAISGALKGIAKDLDTTVIALSQLSRKTDDRGDKRPQLSDLRESGALEQDADLVGLIHRPGFYFKNDPSQQGFAELDLAKQRNGPTGVIKIAWLAEQGRFADLYQDAS